VDKNNKHLIALSADAMLAQSDWGRLFLSGRDEGEGSDWLHCRFDTRMMPPKKAVLGQLGKAVGCRIADGFAVCGTRRR